jgi:hypothetical protein
VIKMSIAEARKRGLLDQPVKAARVRKKDHSTAEGPYLTRCHYCQVEFTTQAAETRHVDDPGHHRFELVLDRKEPHDNDPPARRDAVEDAAPPA